MYRSRTDPAGEHRHEFQDGLFATLEDLLAMEYHSAGEIRHTMVHPDGASEPVALNNLLSVLNRFSCDLVHGNRFGAYFVLPAEFWDRCCDDLRLRGIEPLLLPLTEEGGHLSVLRHCTIYVGGTDDVLMRSDWNGCCWQFRVTDSHQLISRPQALALVGPNLGFEDRSYYLPYFPRWGWEGYTPAPVLEAWARDGDVRALTTLKQMVLDTPRRHYALAAVTSLEALGEQVPEGGYERLDRMALREAQREQMKALA